MTRMVRAELLKLHRNRAVWIGAGLVIVALPVALLLMTLALTSERIGGVSRAATTFELLLGPGLIGAALIGIGAGAIDREAGVLRSLASTGRPRSTLVWVRLPAVLIATVALSLAAWVVTCGIGAIIHSGTDAVTLRSALDFLPSLVAANVVIAVASLGLCTAGLSGAPVLGFVLALTLGLMPILAGIASTPEWLFGLMPPIAVTELFGGSTVAGVVPIASGWALVGLVVWSAGAMVLGFTRLLRAEL